MTKISTTHMTIPSVTAEDFAACIPLSQRGQLTRMLAHLALNGYTQQIRKGEFVFEVESRDFDGNSQSFPCEDMH